MHSIIGIGIFQLFLAVVLQELDGLKFEPITKKASFEVIYNVEVKSDERRLTSKVYEQSNSKLQASNVWLITDAENGTFVKRFIYNLQSGRDVVVEQSSNDRLFMVKEFDVSSSSSYNFPEQLEPANSKDNIYVLPADRSLDSLLLPTPDASVNLNLDAFMESWCLKEVELYLRHVRGLTRLLHLIECLNAKTFLDNKLLEGRESSLRSAYSLIAKPVDKGNESNNIARLDISILLKDQPIDGQNSLPKYHVPSIIELHIESILLARIDILQFRMLDDDESISSSQSPFLLPLSRGVSELLHKQIVQKNKDPKAAPMRISFRAFMTASHMKLADPVELLVAYDEQSSLLAHKIILIDRKSTEGSSYLRRSTRTVYDNNSGFKYHIMHTNSDYTQSMSSEDNSDYTWLSCSTDKLTDEWQNFLFREILQVEDATFMGLSMARGIPCRVYERQIYALPLWLGLEKNEYKYLKPERSSTFLTIYMSSSGIESFNQDAHEKPVRLIVSIVSNDSKRSILMAYKVEIHSFEWSIQRFKSELNMFDVGQECFFSIPESRHFELSMVLKPSVDQKDPLINEYVGLLGSKSLREESILDSFAKKFKTIGRTQMFNLETEYHGNSDNSLHLQIDVFEEPLIRLQKNFVGYAKDLSFGSSKTSEWSAGVTSISLEECQWRAAHSLEAFKRFNLGQKRLFMFCPKTLHCILGDHRWDRLASSWELEIDSLIKYPYKLTNDDRCFVQSVEVIKKVAVKSPFNQFLMDKDKIIGSHISLLRERQQDLVMEIIEMRYSEKLVGDENQLSKGLRGVAYEPSRDSKPFVAFDVAQCSQICLTLHNCNSFSACHNGARFECIFSSVNWTEQVKFGELTKLVHLADVGSQSTTHQVEVHLIDGKSIQVSLRFSIVCSLYPKLHLDLFKFKRDQLIKFGNTEHLLMTDTFTECNQFCLERANLLRTIENSNQPMKDAVQRVWTCVEFAYCRDKSLCKLTPEINMRSYTFDQSDLKQRRWKTAIDRMIEAKLEVSFCEEDIYELEYEQLFTPQSGKRLAIQDRWQMTYKSTSVVECSRLCLRLKDCRSFDIQETEVGEWEYMSTKKPTCYLNGLSELDISNGDSNQTVVRINDENGDKWWHYEPNDIALYMMADQIDLKSKSAHQTDILINVEQMS